MNTNYLLTKLVLYAGKFYYSAIRPEEMDVETRDSKASFERYNPALQVIT